MSFDTFLNAYLECADWADCGPDHETEGAEWAPQTLARFEADARAFYDAHGGDIEDDSQAGHDFWLTRRGHGAGFWDRDGFDQSPALQRLDAAARAFGNLDLYLGDDGRVYAA